mmetsp:Transcript_12390/g.29483  ORF Transcript_12390/g.29483 Transcript_12390/m.29483 type:complete len:220 (+) Transcript_12390:268-927(+)
MLQTPQAGVCHGNHQGSALRTGPGDAGIEHLLRFLRIQKAQGIVQEDDFRILCTGLAGEHQSCALARSEIAGGRILPATTQAFLHRRDGRQGSSRDPGLLRPVRPQVGCRDKGEATGEQLADNRLQQRSLSTATSPHQGHTLAPLDGEVHVAQHQGPAFLEAEMPGHMDHRCSTVKGRRPDHVNGHLRLLQEAFQPLQRAGQGQSTPQARNDEARTGLK